MPRSCLFLGALIAFFAMGAEKNIDWTAAAAKYGGITDKTVSEVQSKAEKGDSDAQYELGLTFYYGILVAKNDAEAAKWLRKAADQGITGAKYFLSLICLKKGATKQEINLGMTLLREAANKGYPEAQSGLGEAYENGAFGAPNDGEAVTWFQRAAEQGDELGQVKLGFMYSQGRAVPKDEVEAVKWYRKAAEQGNAVAQNDLALQYFTGKGVSRDGAEAIKWLRKAAEQGLPQAQLFLGNLYAAGMDVPRDEAEGYKWLLLAGAQGVEKARIAYSALEAKLTPAMREAGQRKAREFKAAKQ